MSLLLALLFLVHESVLTQANLPDTPAASQLSAWLAAFNTGDRTILLKFLEKNEPDRVSHVDETMDFRARTGGFDIQRVMECAELSCIVVVKERNSEQLGQITIEVDPTPAHLIKQMQIRATRGPTDSPVSRMTESEAVSAFKARLETDARIFHC